MALWLNSTEFGAEDQKEEVQFAPSKTPPLPTAASVTKTCEESFKDRMHLMLGKDTELKHIKFSAVSKRAN